MFAKSIRYVSVFMLAALVTVSAFAQTSTTGGITGTVTQAGSPLPGVTLELRSSALQGTRTDVSDAEGNFRFSNLPPGQYTLTGALAGFNPVTQSNISVGLNRTVTLEVAMSLQASEQITVSAAAPVVDVSSAASGANITSETMQSLPIARNFTAAAQVAPGTSADAAGTTVYGSTGAENQYVIDGLNTTGVETGLEGKRLNTEFIQEVEVITGGLSAEYGRMTGGVINAITKSGSNEFHGDVFGYTAGQGGLTSDNNTAADRPATSTTINEVDEQLDYGANLGGYILKDRLWFFGAYDRVNQTDSSLRINTPLIIPGGTDVPVGGRQDSETVRDLYAGKLSLALTPSHNLNFSIFGDPSETEGILPGYTLAGPPSTYSGLRETGGNDSIIRYAGIFGSNVTANASYGMHREKDITGGEGRTIARTQNQTVVPNFFSGGLGLVQDQEFTRDTIKLDAAAFLGSHQVKVGGDMESLVAENTNQFSGTDRVRMRCRVTVTATAPCPAGSVFYTHEGYATGSTTNAANVNGLVATSVTVKPETENTSLYVQDSWKALTNLTLNLGVRWERQEIMDRNGDTAIDLNDMIAPRLGIIYDAMNNGRSKLYANYGRFYETIPMDINIRAFGSDITVQVNNLSPTPGNFNPGTVGPATTAGTVPAVTGTSPFRFLGSGATPVDPDLKGQYVDEFLLGYDQEIANNLSVGIKGTYRNLGQVIEDMLVITTGEYFITNPGTGIGSEAGNLHGDQVAAPKAERKYTGVELHATKRFSNNYQFFASYLWSRLEGNYDGTFQVSTGQLDPNINSAYDYADFSVNNEGLLSNDRTHQAKFYGSYTLANGFAKGLELGASVYWQSGTPLTGLGYEFAGYRNYEYYLTERGSLGRGPSEYEADLHVGFPIAFGGSRRLNLLVDVFNVLNRQAATALDQRMDLSSDAACAVFVRGGQPNGCNGFGGWASVAGTTTPVGEFSNARAAATNPDFLSAGTAFTGARSIRLGARFSF